MTDEDRAPAAPADSGPGPALPPLLRPPSAFQAWTVAGLLAACGFAVFLLGRFAGDRYSADDERALLRTIVALLSIWAGVLWLLLHRTRCDLFEMRSSVGDLRWGAETIRQREAVDLLLRAIRLPDPRVVETAYRNLRRITGEDFGEDPRAWDRWWAGARETFVRPGKR